MAEESNETRSEAANLRKQQSGGEILSPEEEAKRLNDIAGLDNVANAEEDKAAERFDLEEKGEAWWQKRAKMNEEAKEERDLLGKIAPDLLNELREEDEALNIVASVKRVMVQSSSIEDFKERFSRDNTYPEDIKSAMIRVVADSPYATKYFLIKKDFGQ
ncbi:MAG: hypothetical protein KBC81_00735 [Candidatus Pacebacteria bacterium]|nr:hypothetical protein [Candidatus Paceibacterota bacterium]